MQTNDDKQSSFFSSLQISPEVIIYHHIVVIILTEVFGTRTREPVILTGSLAVYDRSLLATRRWASASTVQHISNIQNHSKLVTMGLDKIQLSHEVPRFCFVCGQADWTNGFWSRTPLLKRSYWSTELFELRIFRSGHMTRHSPIWKEWPGHVTTHCNQNCKTKKRTHFLFN